MLKALFMHKAIFSLCQKYFMIAVLNMQDQLFDESFKKVSGAQIRAARSLLGWSQEYLGKMASLTQAPIARMENDISKSRDSTLRLVVQVLEEAGIEFFWEEDGTVGIKLKSTGIHDSGGQKKNNHLQNQQ